MVCGCEENCRETAERRCAASLREGRVCANVTGGAKVVLVKVGGKAKDFIYGEQFLAGGVRCDDGICKRIEG